MCRAVAFPVQPTPITSPSLQIPSPEVLVVPLFQQLSPRQRDVAELLRGNLFPSCSLMPMLLSYSCFPGTSRYSRDLKQSCTEPERAAGTKLKRVWTVWTRSWQVGTALTTGTAQALSSARVEVNNQLSGSTSAESCVKQLFLYVFVHSVRLWRRDAW